MKPVFRDERFKGIRPWGHDTSFPYLGDFGGISTLLELCRYGWTAAAIPVGQITWNQESFSYVGCLCLALTFLATSFWSTLLSRLGTCLLYLNRQTSPWTLKVSLSWSTINVYQSLLLKTSRSRSCLNSEEYFKYLMLKKRYRLDEDRKYQIFVCSFRQTILASITV